MNVAPATRTNHAPDKVQDKLNGRSATYTAIAWDPNFFSGDHSAGIATVTSKDGVTKVASAWAGGKFARDKVRTDVSTGDAYDQAILAVFTAAVDRNQAGLAALVSNLPMDAKFTPKNGTFDFVLDRPGTTSDLRYVGLIEAAPAPIRDILNAATGFRKHF